MSGSGDQNIVMSAEKLLESGEENTIKVQLMIVPKS